MAEKRKRTPNFSQEEKMQFVQAMQMMGNAIITKVTAHDTRSNKEKEELWDKITCHLNASSRSIKRDTAALKKLWQKLKSEAKTYKSIANHQARGTGGGPSKNIDDPVLELVVELTGRGSSGISDVPDCDSEVADFTTKNQPPLNAQPVPPILSPVIEYIQECDVEDEGDQCLVQLSDYVTVTEVEDTIENKKKRRQPLITAVNERTPTSSHGKYSNNRIPSTKFLVEKEKLNLIQLQKEQMKDIHAIKIQNEVEKHQLQMEILKEIKKKIQDAENMDPKLITEFVNNLNT